MEINDQNFEKEVIKNNIPVLIDFYATWCGPCKMQTTIIDDLEKEYKDKVKIVKMDVDANPQTASQFEIMSIPTIVFIKDGQIIERLLGLQSKNILINEINKIIF